MKTFLFAVVCAMLSGCLNKKIEITPEYIINENWNKKSEKTGANSIEIKRLKVKKGTMINPFSDLNQADILDKLEADSSFIYTANVMIKEDENYWSRKIYFNRDNGFYWWTDHGEHKVKILGRLQPNTWYEISRLTYYYYVVYVDSSDIVHRFVVNSANY